MTTDTDTTTADARTDRAARIATDAARTEAARATAATPSARITAEVTSWPGVSAGPGPRGEFGFHVGRRELGHLHGDHAAHFFFGKELGRRLRDEGRVVDHPVFPGKAGTAARRIDGEADVRDVIALLRVNYDRIAEREAERS